MPAVAGCQEAADIAGISRQRFHRLFQLGRVPKPIARLQCGHVWWTWEIEEWAKARDRKPGRKPHEQTGTVR